MTSLITVVTGTYNRLDLLQRMIASARVSVPRGIALDFVIVDGGSRDGTQAWCKAQRDVTLIEHGELRGAIRAFCDGAKAATGDFVVLANDDVRFIGDSLLRAAIHIETHPSCGAVAFEDDRPSPGYEGSGFKVQTMQAIAHDDTVVSVVYAQVGMYRRWLGDECGWWGADDPIMSKGHTYGADNWLSARIWECGFTVDHVPNARCVDLVADDDLRETNARAERKNPGVYYKAYPNGPRLPQRLNSDEREETLRVLYLPVYEQGMAIHSHTKRGLREAMQRRGFLVAELDYLNERVDLPAAVEAFKPHILLTQIHDARSLPAYVLAECRKRKPDMMVINWNGDARGLTDAHYLALLRHVDLQLVVNASALKTYQAAGIPAAYWQIGYEEPHTELPIVPTHDVVMLGTCYNAARRNIEAVLTGLDGVNVGFYGMGWRKPNGDCLYDFAKGEALYQNAKIAISDTFTDGQTDVEGFVSNRLIQAMHAGVLVLQQACPGLQLWTGLQAGVHYVEWKDYKDLDKQIRHWLSVDEGERRAIADAGKAHVDKYYNFDALLDRLFDRILPQVEAQHVTA